MIAAHSSSGSHGARFARSSGSVVATAIASAVGEGAVNGKKPESSRYITTPSDHTSARGSIVFAESSCSGAM